MKNPWIHWGIFKSIDHHNHANCCGELCSLRFTWQRPRKSASEEKVFIEESFLCFLDLAERLAEAPLKTLHAVKSPDSNILFALAEFENRVTAEFDMNEALPDSMPDIFFLKANYSGGHVTNQPLGGHFNESGSVFADQDHLDLFTVESFDPEVAAGIYESMIKIGKLKDTPEIPDEKILLAAIRKAVYR